MESSFNLLGVQLAGPQMLFIWISSLFGLIGWSTVFLETYLHFSKIDKDKRISMSFVNATILTAIVLAVCYVAFQYYLGEVLK
jgi:hypothetical protein